MQLVVIGQPAVLHTPTSSSRPSQWLLFNSHGISLSPAPADAGPSRALIRIPRTAHVSWLQRLRLRVMERAERSAAHSVPIRDSTPLTSAHPRGPSHDRAWASQTGGDGSHPSGADVWSGAIQRLQTQSSLNTSMLESHRRQLSDISHRVDALVQEMGNATAAIHDLRNQLRAKPVPTASSRHDLGDLDLLVGQVEAVTSKANEVDALKLQLDLMKRRMKRLEEQTDLSAPGSRPGLPPSPGQQMPPFHETPASSHHSPYAHPHPQQQPLPPMRTGSMASPGAPGHSTPPQPTLLGIDNQGRPKYPPPTDSRHYASENAPIQPSSLGGFRPSEPLPPPTSLPGWRSSESLSHSSTLPHPPPPSAHSRPQALEPEPHAGGWASINTAQPAKRPFEEPRISPYHSPGSGSPKRPKLAPIMPRSSYGDEPMAQPHPDHDRNRTASESSQPASQMGSSSSVPPASTNGPSYRFITSTAPTESQEPWRPEHERRMHGHHRHGHSHDHAHHGHHEHGHGQGHGHGHGHGGRGGRGGRRGGGGRGRRARGGGVLIPGEAHQELGAGAEHHQWEQERGEWVANPALAPNGYYHPLHPLSPRGGGLGRRGGGAGAPSDRDGDILPDTPPHGSDDLAHGAAGEAGGLHSGSGSAGKKTRSKPIRNAEGILIRKDGRPDMRSVSSANNLRKVHAKKEAERAEMDVKPLMGGGGGATRSLAPAPAYSEEDGDGEEGDVEGEEENTNATPSGTPGSREEQDEDGGEEGDDEGEHRDPDRHGDTIAVRAHREGNHTADRSVDGSQSADVVMQESSDAATDDHDDDDGKEDKDTRMPTVEEESEEEESTTT